jgi:DNA polymerase-3 subunit gamma/tau
MSYIVFARKYRPLVFDEIIGQPHITTTLKNAIAKDKVAHAYLFAGPRGVGKTTTARILAKALNCAKGPAVDPCNACSSCNEISQGVNLDVLEIDGASNRGIDEIRNLRDNVKFAPSKGKFKIYIIDEVHMLTAEAFNALLKTLEEPPPHVKFIFATTQSHKVPPTILSRCQRFDFRRISAKSILEALKAISEKERFDIDGDILALIAKHADGSMRDGQVVLDQITSFARERIKLEDVARMLGLVGEDALFGLSSAVKDKDALKALKMIDALVNEGKDVVQTILSLIEHFRNMAIIKISKDLDSLIDVGPEKMKRYEEEARRFSIEEILYIVYALSNTIDLVKRSNLPRIPLETVMIKLTKVGSVMPFDEIMKRLGRSTDRGPEVQEIEPRKPDVIDSKTPEKEVAPLRKESGPSQAVSENLSGIFGSWKTILNTISRKKMPVALYLQEGEPIGMEAGALTIGFPKSSKFHKEALESPEYRRIIEDSIKEALNADIRVNMTFIEGESVKERTVIEPIEDENAALSFEENSPVKEGVEPIIKSALDIFKGELKRPADRRRNGGAS